MDTVSVTLKNVKTLYLVSCIANGMVFVSGEIFVLILGASTCGVGCLLFVIPLLNLTGMVLDIVAMVKVDKQPSSGVYSFLKFVAIFDILCWALIPVIMGIFNLMNLAKPEVYEHFHGQQAST